VGAGEPSTERCDNGRRCTTVGGLRADLGEECDPNKSSCAKMSLTYVGRTSESLVGADRYFGLLRLCRPFAQTQTDSDTNGTGASHGFAVSDGDTVGSASSASDCSASTLPRREQPCDDGHWYPGPLATKALVVDYDWKNSRPVAICYAGKDDLQALMVSAGWAWAYTAFSDQCVDAERRAAARGGRSSRASLPSSVEVACSAIALWSTCAASKRQGAGERENCLARTSLKAVRGRWPLYPVDRERRQQKWHRHLKTQPCVYCTLPGGHPQRNLPPVRACVHRSSGGGTRRCSEIGCSTSGA